MKKITAVATLITMLFLCFTGTDTVFAGTPSIPTFSAAGGYLMIEAENTYVNPTLFTETAETTASGGKVLVSTGSHNSPVPSPTISGAEFHVTVDTSSTYYLWVLASAATGGNDSIYSSIDGAAYTYGGLTIDAAGAYKWCQILTTSALTGGTTHTIRLHPRESGAKIDKILFTTSSSAPVEIPNVLTPAPEVTLSPYAYPAPTITPPASHPRILFTSADIPGIKTNINKTKNASAKSQFNSFLGQNFSLPSGSVYDATTLGKIEAWAFDYAINGTVAQGQKAIYALFSYLPNMTFSGSDVSRALGHAIFTASEVYDWCYPLLTEEQKYTIRYHCEQIAKGRIVNGSQQPSMEIGYPPNQQAAVVGHGGEAQLMRDLLSFGIATYNERPDIYNYTAGRYLSQFIQTRNYWNDSHTHHQGSAYGPYRFQWDMWGQILFKKMSGVDVLSSQTEFVPYEWIYTRRPDGQLLRGGDDFNERNANLGTYWTAIERPAFYAAAAFENPYTRWQYEKTRPSYNAFTYPNDSLTPVQMLALNNPDAPAKSPSDLPLSKYFGSPNGMMVARTGWDDATSNANNSDDIVAYMRIGEVWAANHQHLDAGSFQLYYKGILASDSGQYDSYNSNHDKNYNKETIAHNALLIYNSSESIFGGAVNSGGQRRPGNEPANMSAWITGTTSYQTGQVLDHGFGPDPITPAYTYIKGDITKAYTSKVSEVLRSMLFMPLNDTNYPGLFFVMDKVVSASPTYKKTWLLHTQEEPSVSGNTTTVVRTKQKSGAAYYNGRMHVQTLLPQNATITKIGGTGNEFNVNGTNYAPSTSSGTANEPGWGRVEVSPATANTTDYFLNVMCVSDNSKNLNALPATLIETAALAGAKISNRVVMFAKNKTRISDPIQFTVPGNESSGLKIVVTGAAEGLWHIYKNSELVGIAGASADDGVLYFDGGAGSYKLVSALTLNTPSNLNQIYGATQPVAFNTAVGSTETVEPATIQWTVNGAVQATTGRNFVYTPVNAGTYMVSAKVSGNPGAIVAFRTITVAKAAQNPPAIGAAKTQHSITITPVAGAQYGLKLKGSPDAVVYGSTNQFTGLSAGTAYTVYIRLAATDNYEVSAPASMDVTTNLADPPPVTANDLTNTISGFDAQTMEYALSTNGGATYSAYTYASLPGLGGNKVIKFRYKAIGAQPASADAVLTFTPNYGDVDGNGEITISDVIMTAEIAVGEESYTMEQKARANVSDKVNTTVDISDVVLIAERAAGNNDLFPIES